MSKLLYTNGLHGVNWASDTIKVLLERSTSAYTPNIDHDFLDAFTGGGGVEVTVASYARQSLASKAKAADDTKNQMEYDAADIAFGNLESGQIAKAMILYKQVGGNDASPEDDVLIAYDDGKIDVVLAANATSGDTLIWVQPLEADVPAGATLNFGSGATATIGAAASRGARSLSVSAIAANATAGAVSNSVATTSIFASAFGGAVLQGGPFSVQWHGDGLIILTQRGLFAT